MACGPSVLSSRSCERSVPISRSSTPAPLSATAPHPGIGFINESGSPVSVGIILKGCAVELHPRDSVGNVDHPVSGAVPVRSSEVVVLLRDLTRFLAKSFVLQHRKVILQQSVVEEPRHELGDCLSHTIL